MQGQITRGLLAVCPCSAGLLAGICWKESKKFPLFPMGVGTMVTNDWCITGSPSFSNHVSGLQFSNGQWESDVFTCIIIRYSWFDIFRSKFIKYWSKLERVVFVRWYIFSYNSFALSYLHTTPACINDRATEYKTSLAATAVIAAHSLVCVPPINDKYEREKAKRRTLYML